jgi:hypothetical protein
LGPKRDTVKGQWIKLQNEELNDLYSLLNYCSGDQIEKNEMGCACSTYGGEERCIHEFGGEPEGKRPLGRPSRRWDNNTKKDIQGLAFGGMDWIVWLRIGTGGWHL